jgi:hypothetical protein
MNGPATTTTEICAAFTHQLAAVTDRSICAHQARSSARGASSQLGVSSAAQNDGYLKRSA